MPETIEALVAKMEALNKLRLPLRTSRPLAELIAEIDARLAEIEPPIPPAPLPRAVVVRRSRW
jgi:hypothetical protein